VNFFKAQCKFQHFQASPEDTVLRDIDKSSIPDYRCKVRHNSNEYILVYIAQNLINFHYVSLQESELF